MQAFSKGRKIMDAFVGEAFQPARRGYFPIAGEKACSTKLHAGRWAKRYLEATES